MRVKVKIEGTSPLLMHKFNPEDLGPGKKKVDKNASKEEQAARLAYKTEDGTLYVPSLCMFA